MKKLGYVDAGAVGTALLLSGCGVPIIEPAIPEVHGQVSKSGVPVANAVILASDTCHAGVCQGMKQIAMTDATGKFSYGGERTIRFVIPGSDGKPNWDFCITYSHKNYVAWVLPDGFGIPAEITMTCDLDAPNDAQRNTVCR